VSTATRSTERPAAPALVGLGNIGSHAVQLLPDLADVTHVDLIDPDRYAASNLGGQRFSAKEVGCLKVLAQARALRALAPDIAVDTYACPIEAVPLGKLRGRAILSCVDSRSARQSINRIATRLGLPWIDSGLDRAGSVRARVYVPGSGDCLECSWGARDYALLDQRLPCNAASSAAPPTAAPAELGSIAAGLQVALLRSLLSAQSPADVGELARKQWFLDVPSCRGWIGRYAPNPHCRFDHAQWVIEPLARGAREVTLGEIFDLAGAEAGDAVFSVEARSIVRRVRCVKCGRVKEVGGRLLGRFPLAGCRRCGGSMMAAATDACDALSRTTADAGWLDRPLAAFGLVDGDVFSLRVREATIHHELGRAPAREA